MNRYVIRSTTRNKQEFYLAKSNGKYRWTEDEDDEDIVFITTAKRAEFERYIIDREEIFVTIKTEEDIDYIDFLRVSDSYVARTYHR